MFNSIGRWERREVFLRLFSSPPEWGAESESRILLYWLQIREKTTDHVSFCVTPQHAYCLLASVWTTPYQFQYCRLRDIGFEVPFLEKMGVVWWESIEWCINARFVLLPFILISIKRLLSLGFDTTHNVSIARSRLLL